MVINLFGIADSQFFSTDKSSLPFAKKAYQGLLFRWIIDSKERLASEATIKYRGSRSARVIIIDSKEPIQTAEVGQIMIAIETKKPSIEKE